MLKSNPTLAIDKEFLLSEDQTFNANGNNQINGQDVFLDLKLGQAYILTLKVESLQTGGGQVYQLIAAEGPDTSNNTIHHSFTTAGIISAPGVYTLGFYPVDRYFHFFIMISGGGVKEFIVKRAYITPVR